MKLWIKKSISVFLVAIIGFTAFGSTYFLESGIDKEQQEKQLIFHSDFNQAFEQGLEFASSKINVPGFKVMDTVFDLLHDNPGVLFTIAENGALKANWLEKCHRFFCIHTLLYPFHYFW